jgi:hypothetical protein
MGTFYRSKHELVFVFKVGTASHTNTFGLGDGGRYRTNVWDFAGVNAENRMYLLDLWWAQASADVWIEAWCDLVRKWRPALWVEEQGRSLPGWARSSSDALLSGRRTHAASSS